MPICTCNTPVLGAPASIMGSELPRRPRYVAPALIHRSAWKMNSANFAFWSFSEVHPQK
jgi:hypothetical protein